MAVLSLVATLSHAIEVVVTAEVQTSSRPTIQGYTNLPDGTKLSVSVTRKESAYHAEVLTEVNSGAFIVGPLSQRGADLNPGLYEVEIAVVAATDQPVAVREVIGGQGEKLRGPLAKREGGGRTGCAIRPHSGSARGLIRSLIVRRESGRSFRKRNGGRSIAARCARTRSALRRRAAAGSVGPTA